MKEAWCRPVLVTYRVFGGSHPPPHHYVRLPPSGFHPSFFIVITPWAIYHSPSDFTNPADSNHPFNNAATSCCTSGIWSSRNPGSEITNVSPVRTCS